MKVNPVLRAKDVKALYAFMLDGVEVRLPITEKGILLFTCKPHCGNCCRGGNEQRLSLLPRDQQAMADHFKLEMQDFIATKTKLSTKSRLPVLVNEGRKQCQLLNKSQKCTIYPVRPFGCRMYPFHFNVDGQLGYLEDAFENCPGLYFDKSVEPMIPLLRETIAEMKYAFDTIANSVIRQKLKTEQMPKDTPGSIWHQESSSINYRHRYY